MHISDTMPTLPLVNNTYRRCNTLNISNLGGGVLHAVNPYFLIYFIRYQMLRLRHLTIRRAYSLLLTNIIKQNTNK